MPYTKEELTEAKRQIDSTLYKLREVFFSRVSNSIYIRIANLQWKKLTIRFKKGIIKLCSS